MSYRDALKAADPIALAVALAMFSLTHFGGLDKLGLTPETALEGAALVFALAASIRAALEHKRSKEDANGGVLR